MRIPVRTLSSRQWLGVIWAAYLGLPLLVLVTMLGLGEILLGGQSRAALNNAMPIFIAAAVIAQLSVPVLAIVFVGWAVLKPLRAMNAAALKVGKYDLEFSLPSSRVREVDEALKAFTTMGEELRAALAREAVLEEERRFFISAIAHDINSPIFALRGYLEGLETGVAATPERAQHYVQVCKAKVSELERLAADLFAYTQTEWLEQTIRLEPLDPGRLLLDTVESIRPQLDSKSLILTLPDVAPVCCCAVDPHLLQRALTNVLENAIRYTPAGGAITVDYGAAGDQWRFTIADTGPGIAADDAPHLFAPLYRGEASRNRATGGIGLGLAIALRIMRAHGGTLTTVNGASVGAIFTGTVPRT